jgi:hypothetical protein
MPERMSEYIPESMSEKMPDRMSDGMSKYICQKECQIKCLKHVPYNAIYTSRWYFRNCVRIMFQGGDHSKKVTV